MMQQIRFHAEPPPEDAYEKEEIRAVATATTAHSRNRCMAGHGHADLKW
jgi:hypothetical protein